MPESNVIRQIIGEWWQELLDENKWFRGKFCEVCGGPVSFESKYCRQHWLEVRPRKIPSDTDPHLLIARVQQGESYLAIGRSFGVSDNAIRKFIRAKGLQPPKRASVKVKPVNCPGSLVKAKRIGRATGGARWRQGNCSVCGSRGFIYNDGRRMRHLGLSGSTAIGVVSRLESG